jgi:hypothetical protein
MKRIIIDYKKLTPQILSLLSEKYPDGYDDNDIIEFKNMYNDLIEAVQVETKDTIYLVKVSSNLHQTIVAFDLDDDDDVHEIPTVPKEIDEPGFVQGESN